MGKTPRRKNLYLEVKDIKQFLKSHGIEPGSEVDNKKKVRDLANTMRPTRIPLFPMD